MKHSAFTDRSTFIILFMFFIIHNSSLADFETMARCQHTSSEFSCVEYVKNYDGDTITFNIREVHPLLGDQLSVRVLGIDTAEMDSKDECEVLMAKKAQIEVQALMKKARRVDLVSARRGKFFRVVADVIFDGQSLQDYLVRQKLAVVYDGGHKDPINWCRFL